MSYLLCKLTLDQTNYMFNYVHMYLTVKSSARLGLKVEPKTSYIKHYNLYYNLKRFFKLIIGEESRLLHVLDLSDPKNPTLATSHQFTPSDGTPRDVAICGDEVAVAVTSGIKDVYEGHVYFFHAFTGGSPGLTSDGKLPG